MNQTHNEAYQKICERLAIYNSTRNDDIVLSLVEKALRRIEAHIKEKIKEGQSKIEQLQKQLFENYNSLQKDYKPWKATVFETMVKGLNEDLNEIEAQMQLFQPQQLEKTLLGAIGLNIKEERKTGKEYWFEKEYTQKYESVIQGHQIFIKAFDLYSKGEKDLSTLEKEKGSDLGNLACKASLYSQELKANETYEIRSMNLRKLQELADAGSLGALNNVGYCFLNGIGCHRNQSKGLFHLMQALERGCRYSAYYLADAYMNQFNDYKKALVYFRLFISFPISEYHNVEIAIKEIKKILKQQNS